MVCRLRGGVAAGLGFLLATMALAGCGQEGAARFSEDASTPGGNGRLTVAIAERPGSLDPLRASTYSAQLVARQVFEPLVSRQQAPYGEGSSQRGLALSWGHSGDFRVWGIRLRPGVDFQDGESFNANAVAANARRWIRDRIGQALLPGLIAADAPRPSLSRFIFAVPMTDLSARLEDPRLGIVSPVALAAGVAPGSIRAPNGGTGAFRMPVGGASGSSTLVVRRNDAWWGSDAGLGPALDEIAFRVEADPRERVRLLRSEEAQAAAEITAAQALELRSEPLLTVLPGGAGDFLGLERSVRGIDTGGPQALSHAWLTVLQGG